MPGLMMRKKDLIELYQQLKLYKSVYPEDSQLTLPELITAVEGRYRDREHGEDIRSQTNPRDAGRKPVYSEQQNQKIYSMYQEKITLRRIAEESGCSVGHVQDVIRKKEQDGIRFWK